MADAHSGYAKNIAEHCGSSVFKVISQSMLGSLDQSSTGSTHISWSKCSDLLPETCNHRLHLLVHSVEVIVERTSTAGIRTRIGEIVVGDDTGCVVISAKNEQIDMLTPGCTVIIQNGRVDMFDGYLRLRIDKWGTLQAYQAPHDNEKVQIPTHVNLSNNISVQKYQWIPM